MAETVPNTTGVMATEPDDLAALRAKKQRQLAAMPVSSIAPPESVSPAVPITVAPEPPIPGTTSETSTVTPTTDESAEPPPSAAKPRRQRQTSPRTDRVGQVMISGYFQAETRRRLKIIAARQDKTLQQVMAEAFEAWLRRQDKDG